MTILLIVVFYLQMVIHKIINWGMSLQPDPFRGAGESLHLPRPEKKAGALQILDHQRRTYMENLWKIYGKCMDIYEKCMDHIWKTIKHSLSGSHFHLQWLFHLCLEQGPPSIFPSHLSACHLRVITIAWKTVWVTSNL